MQRLFWNVLLEAQKHSFLLKEREAGRRREQCLWLAVSFWVCSNLKEREAEMEKQSLRTPRALPGCADLQLEKQRSQLKLTLARDVKKLQEKIHQVLKQQAETEENTSSLLNTRGVTNKAAKMEILKRSFTCHHQHCWTSEFGNTNPGSCKQTHHQ